MDFMLFKALWNPTPPSFALSPALPPLPRGIVVEITSKVTHKDYNAWI